MRNNETVIVIKVHILHSNNIYIIHSLHTYHTLITSTACPVYPDDELNFDDSIVYEKQRDCNSYKGTYITINNTSITPSLHPYHTLITSTTCPIYPEDELTFDDIIVYEKQRDCDSYKGTYITLNNTSIIPSLHPYYIYYLSYIL
jgi:ribosomal protein L19